MPQFFNKINDSILLLSSRSQFDLISFDLIKNKIKISTDTIFDYQLISL